MFQKDSTYINYIIENFTNITPLFIDNNYVKEYCELCKVTMGFEIDTVPIPAEKKHLVLKTPQPLLLTCPVCHSFKIWIVQNIFLRGNDNIGSIQRYRIMSIPKEQPDIPEMPGKPHYLKKLYIEGVKCLEAGCPIAAAVIFKRAIHVLTRELLGATPGTLMSEFRSIINKRNKLGVVLHETFKNNPYLEKESSISDTKDSIHGHDIILFTDEDAYTLHEIFVELIVMLFVLPNSVNQAREHLLTKKSTERDQQIY
ncbi:hypothetical protein J7L67_07610 [bacterium]|nr:hypothetical protein [bacterium]